MFAFFNKLGKKADQENKPFPTPVHRPEGLPKIPTLQPFEPEKKVKAVEKKRVEFQSSLDLVANYEGERAISDDAFTYREIQENSTENISIENSSSIFSNITIDEAKKAVVYSEILQRKY